MTSKWPAAAQSEGKRAVDDLAELPAELLALVCAHLDTSSLAACLLVSRLWRAAFGTCLRALAPRHGLLLQLPQLFPSLESLSLERSIGGAVSDAALAASVLPLSRLTRLCLRACSSLTAQGLAALSQLQGLQDLDLSGCKRLTARALAVLPSLRLRRLQLDKCELLSDAALDHLAVVTGLQELSLCGCTRICGPGLENLVRHQQLTSLNLSGLPELEDAALAPLSRLASLQHLVLDRCYGLTGVGLSALAPLQQLRALSLMECQVADAAMPAVAQLLSLRHLSLDFCRITDFGLAALSPLRQLHTLNLRGCEGLRGDGFAALAQCTRLSSLNLSWAPRLTLGGVEALASLSCLQELWLPWCGLDNRQVQALRSLSALRGLSVARSTDLTLAGIEALVQGCRHLTRLDINGCVRVDDECLAALAHLPQLAALNVCGCQVTDAGLARLALGATALKELNLAYSSVSSIEALGALPRLRHVNVHGSRCRVEVLAELAQPSSPLSCVDVVPPWVLGRL